MALWGCCLLSFQTGLWGGHLYIFCEIFPVLTILTHIVLGPLLGFCLFGGLFKKSLLAFQLCFVKLKFCGDQPCFPVLVLFKAVQNLSESITLILSMIILYQTNNFMITPNLVTLSLTWSPDISQRPFHCPE